MSLHRVRLELAPCPQAPDGDSRCGYELTVPLDREGRLQPASWQRRSGDCRVRRFWFGQDYRSGILVHTGQGHWAFSQLPSDSRGQPIWQLESDRLVENEIVRVTELDGVVRPFRVARVRALLRLFGRPAAEGNLDKRHG